MRPIPWVTLAFLLAVMAAPQVHAQASLASSIHVAHPVLYPGQGQVVTVTARDLGGRPLVGARAHAQVQIGKQIHRYSMAPTSRSGVSVVSIHPARIFVNVRVTVRVSVTNGFLTIPLSTSFDIRRTSVPVKPSPVVTPGRSVTPVRTPGAPRPSPTPTRPAGVKTATPTATPTDAVQTGAAVIVPRAVPDRVNAPGAAWIVAFLHTAAGAGLSGMSVQAVAPFAEGSVTGVGVTDSSGVANILIDTSEVRATQTVLVQVKATYGSQIVSGTTTLTVDGNVPTSAPTLSASNFPTAVPTTGSSVYPTAVPTWTPLPTDVPLPTNTPIPTSVPTSVRTSTPAPTPTNIPGCPGSMDACMQAELAILNNTRAQYGVPPLTLNSTQSLGTGTCVGSLGHSQAMQASGYIWHVNPAYPSASFPSDICVSAFTFGENVGMSQQGNEQSDLQYMQQLMMSEPHDSATCATTVDHACNIISSKFTKVGIGIYNVNGATWLTTDFVG